MAAALVSKKEHDVEEFGRDVVVPDNPKARLMYYVHSIYNVIDMTPIRNIQKLRDYRNYRQLNDAETKELYQLCMILSPEKLKDKVIFQDNALCRGDANKFYKINTTEHNLIVSEAVIIGGKRLTVRKMMAYTVPWIQWIYIGPMDHFKRQYPSLNPVQEESCNVM